MSSGGFPGGGGGGDKRIEDKATTDNVQPVVAPTLTGAHAHILPQQPIVPTLQTIRPKINPVTNIGQSHNPSALSAILPTGIVTNPSEGSHGHIATTASSGLTATAHPTIPVPVSIPQTNIVHLGAPAAGVVAQPLASGLPLNVIRGSLQGRPQFASHLPRGAIAAASALTKTGPNIATAAATAVVRPPVQIPASAATLHGSGTIPGTIQNPLGRTIQNPLSLSAIKSGTPPSTRSPSPAVSITTAQPPVVDAHRPGFSLHNQTVPTTTQSIQITLTTTRSTTAIEIPKPVIAHSQPTKPLNIPQPLSLQAPSKVTPLLQHQAVAGKTVSLSMPGHVSSVSATPVTLSSIATTTTVAAPSIPIAKVTPQRQQQSISQSSSVSQPQSVQDLSRGEVTGHSHAQPPGSSGIFHPQTHRLPTTTAPLTTAITIPSSTPQDNRHESRPVGNLPQLSHFNLPGQDSMWQYSPMPYPQLVYQQVAAQAQAQTQSPLSTNAAPVRGNLAGTLIFPRPQVDQSVPGQNPQLAATLQAHAMTMASAQSVRFANSMMVQVQEARHPMSVHPQFGTSSAMTSGASLPQQDSKPIITSSAATIGVCRTPPPASHDPSHNMSLASAATVASSIYTSSPNMQTQQPPTSSGNNPSASPRPSILRKRTSEGVGVVVKRPLGLMPDSHSPRPEPSQPQSNTSSPKTPAGDNNSQSSTDTALSSNDATTPTQNSHMDVKIKQEPPDGLENGPSILNNLASSPVANSVEASPRKKPRKQLLNATEELKDNTSTDEETEKTSFKENKSKEMKREHKDEYVDEDGVRWTTDKKRPNVNLLHFYNITWKPKNNHFTRFTEVKPKEERRPTVNELSNQRGIQQKSSGWKLYHMASQLENLHDLEKDMCARISHLQAALAPRPPVKQTTGEDYDGIIHELSQANIQRCQLIGDQLEEARTSMLKILEHKPRIQEIITKHMSKRPIKKKERT